MYTGVSNELTQQLNTQLGEVEVLHAIVTEATTLIESELFTELLEASLIEQA